MEAKSTDKKTFQLTDNGELLGELHYESLFSHRAEIKLANNDHYEIKPVGIFGTSILVTKNGEEFAHLKMNWRGQIVFTLPDGEEYLFIAKGAFLSKYTLANKEGKNLILFDPKFDWSKFNYSYTISYDTKPQDNLFILLGIYASNYYIAVMSGAIAGTA